MKPKYISEVGDLIINDAHPNKLLLERNLKYLSKRMLWKFAGIGLLSILGMTGVIADIWRGNPIGWMQLITVLISALVIIGPVVVQFFRRDSFTINTITREFSKNNKKLLALDEVDHIALLAVSDKEKTRFNLALSDGNEEKMISDDLSRDDAEAIAAKLTKYLQLEVVERTAK